MDVITYPAFNLVKGAKGNVACYGYFYQQSTLSTQLYLCLGL